ncbi:hypothetical protein DE146DRAFT_651147 [Phaeosphaeria sp. MPI-PUGE-AT-0046c]|nr:hypothetical protein DE146DRAFT_651147 [Phaeosphaeria sp. MPI-PUGE-AT-0046c]
MDCCVAAVIHSAYSAILEKSYAGIPSVDPSTIESFILPLHRHVQEAVEQVLLTHPLADVDWDTQVLEPTIAEFHVVAELGMSAEDVEYVLLIGTVVTLAYEILLLPRVEQNKCTWAFHTKILNEYLCEPEIHHRITERLQLEQHQLELINARTSVRDAIGALRRWLPDIWTTTVVWERRGSHSHHPCHKKPTDTKEDDNRNSYLLPHDSRITIHLKTGKAMFFEPVESNDTSSGIVIMKTYSGLQMEV